MPTSFNLPSPYQQQMADIDRRQKMSEILQQQSFQPIEKFGYNGIEAPIPATAGLAKILSQMTPMLQQNNLAQERKETTATAVAEQKQDFSDILKAMSPTPAVPGLAAVTPFDIEDRDKGGTGAPALNMNMVQETKPGYGNPGTEGAAAQAASPTAAYLAMMKSKNPELAASGLQGFLAYNQTLTAQQQAIELEKLKKMMPSYGDDEKIKNDALMAAARQQQADVATANARFTGALPASGGAPAAPGVPGAAPAPAGAPAPGAGGFGTPPARPPGMSDKDYQELLRKDAEENAKKSRSMFGVQDTISKAREILNPTKAADGTVASKPTSGMAGNAIDWATDFFGINTEAKTQAGRLRMLGGWLMSSVPRMEGPQSDADVKNYQTMAAAVGNANLSISERLAALDELEGIVARYDSNGVAKPGAPAGAGGAPARPGVPSATGSVKWGRDPVSGKPMVIRQ